MDTASVTSRSEVTQLGKLQWWVVMLWRHEMADRWIQSWSHHGRVGQPTPLEGSERALFRRGYDTLAELEQEYKNAGPIIRVAINDPIVWRLRFVQSTEMPEYNDREYTDVVYDLLDEEYR